jgi:hypothetical protein
MQSQTALGFLAASYAWATRADDDLVLHFKTQETTIVCGDISVFLTGKIFGGQAIERADSRRIVDVRDGLLTAWARTA